jgi:hypothetical protein
VVNHHYQILDKRLSHENKKARTDINHSDCGNLGINDNSNNMFIEILQTVLLGVLVVIEAVSFVTNNRSHDLHDSEQEQEANDSEEKIVPQDVPADLFDRIKLGDRAKGKLRRGYVEGIVTGKQEFLNTFNMKISKIINIERIISNGKKHTRIFRIENVELTKQ